MDKYLFMKRVIESLDADYEDTARKRKRNSEENIKSESSKSLSTQSTQDVRNVTAGRLLESQSRSLAEEGHNVGHILQDKQRKSLKGRIVIAKNLIKEGIMKKEELASKLAKIRNLPLEVIWWYHMADIIHIAIYIALNLSDSEQLERVGNGLHELMCCPSGDGIEAAVATDLLAALTRLVHGPEPPRCLSEPRKACDIILQSIIRKQLAAFNSDKGSSWWLQKLVGPSSCLPSVVEKSFAVKLLQMELTEPPFISLHQALTRQAEWNFKDAPKNITAFFSQLLRAVEQPSGSALEILTSVLQRDVNWKAVVICVSTFLHTMPEAATRVSNLVLNLIGRSFSTNDKEIIVFAFILARQCSVEGSAVGCLSYSAWFKKTFGLKSSSLASSVSHVKFLLDFLTQLVPHEPANCLRVHVEQSPYVTAACRSNLQDYLALANTRLRDLGQGESIGLFPSEGTANSLEEQVKYDVQKALSHFETSGKVHQSVFEGCIFKRKYFENNFLPELLKPRILPSANDTQMLFIDKLLAASKISISQYDKYHSQCLSAAANANL